MMRGGRVNNKSTKKRPFEKAWSLEIEGDVQHFCPIVERVASEISIDKYVFEARPNNSKTKASFAWFDIFIIDRTTAYQIPLGVLTLESPGSNRTILRVPPRSQWSRGDFSPEELARMGYIERDNDAIQFFSRLFMRFIDSLDITLKNYGVKQTRIKKLWRRFNRIIDLWNKLKP